MKVSRRKNFSALLVVLALFVLFQNCAPAKITSSDSEISASNSDDLGSSAPPNSTPTPVPGGTPPVVVPGASPTPVMTPTPVPGPAMSVSTNLLDFGNVQFGSMSPVKLIKITNSGTTSLRITANRINSTYFYEDIFADTCGATIEPGQSCDIGIKFDAFVTMSITGILRIESNALNSPVLVQLQGRGVF